MEHKPDGSMKYSKYREGVFFTKLQWFLKNNGYEHDCQIFLLLLALEDLKEALIQPWFQNGWSVTITVPVSSQ